jgi:hypothetical protein
MTADIPTDGHGRPQVTPEMMFEKALSQGRVHEGERSFWLAHLRAHPDQAADQLLKRRPSRLALAEARRSGNRPISEESYLNFARATGVISMRDDPRVKPSWR